MTIRKDTSTQTAFDLLQSYADSFFKQGDLNDPNKIDGELQASLRVNLPGHAIVDRGHFYNFLADYHSLFPQSIWASTRTFKINDGLVHTPRGEPIASIDTLKIYPNGTPDHLLPNAEGTSLEINEKGIPELQLVDAFTGIPIPGDRPLNDFAQQMPIGKKPDGTALFEESELQDNEAFPFAQLLRKSGVPERLPLSVLMLHGLQMLGVTPPMRPDPEMDLNLPPNPLKLIQELNLKGSLTLPDTLILPGANIPNIGILPGAVIHQNQGGIVSFDAKMDNQLARNDEAQMSLAGLIKHGDKTWEEWQMIFADKYGFITFTDGTTEETFPLSYFNPQFCLNPHFTEQTKKWGTPDEVWERLKTDGYITKNGDIRSKYCNNGKPSIRLTENKPLTSFKVLLDVNNHQLKSITLDGNPKITLPVTTNLKLFLSAFGDLNNVSLQDWILHLSASGSITPTGDLSVPSLIIADKEIPGVTIPLTKNATQGVALNDFKISMDKGELDSQGSLIANIDAAEIQFAPPGTFWNKLGLGAIPVLGNTMGQLQISGNGSTLNIKAKGSTATKLPIPILEQGITIQSLAATLTDLNIDLSTDPKTGLLVSKGSLGSELSTSVLIKENQIKLNNAKLSVDDLQTAIDIQNKRLEASAKYTMGLGTLEAILPGFTVSMNDGEANGSINVSGPFNNLTAGLDAYFLGTLKTPFAEIATMVMGDATVTRINSDQAQQLKADFYLDHVAYDNKNSSKVIGSFNGNVSIRDGNYLSSKKDHYQRHLSLHTLEGKLDGISHLGFTIKGNVSVGKEAKLRESDSSRETIEPGINFFTQVQGNELAKQVLGPVAEAEINVRLNKAQLSFAGQSVFASGQMVGRIKMVNLSRDPLKPDFRPQPGFTFEIRNSNIVANIGGKKTTIRGTVRITEQNGVIRIFGQQFIPGENGPETTFTPYATIKLGKDALKSLTVGDTQIPYYEPKNLESLMVNFSLRVFNKSLASVITEGQKELVTKGWAKVRDLFKKPKISYSVSTPFGDRNLSINNTEIRLMNGGIKTWGSHNKATTIVSIPDTFVSHKIKLADGSTVNINGTIKLANPIRTTVNLKTLAIDISKDPVQLEAKLTITSFDKDGYEKSKASHLSFNLSSNAVVTPRIDKAKKEFTLNIDIPHSELSAKINSALCAGPVTLCPGTELKLPLSNMGGFIAVNLSTLSAQGEWALGDIKLDLKAPGSPLSKAQLPLNGPLLAEIDIRNPNKISFSADFKKGFMASFTQHPILTKVMAQVGEDLKVSVANQLSAGDIQANITPQGLVTLSLADVLHQNKLDGFVNMDGTKLNLNDIVVSNLIKKASVTFNPETTELSIKIDHQTNKPDLSPPTNISDWLSWSHENWEKYREQLNSQERQFLAVITEPMSKLPGISVPPGKGKIYVDLPASEFKIKFSDFKKPEEAIIGLVNQIGESVASGMLREYPVPTSEMLQSYEGNDIVFNNKQNPEGTFFILGDSDTTQLILSNLGLPGGITGNKRIDLADFSESKIIGRYLKDSLPDFFKTLANHPSPYFTNWELRALTYLGRINTDADKLFKKTTAYRGELSRATSTINFDYESARGALKDEKHVNMTSLTYLPQNPEAIGNSLKDTQGLISILDWFPDHIKRPISEKITQGPIHMTELNSQIAPDDKVMTHAASRFIVLPITDNIGEKRTILIQDQALGLTGDYTFLNGRERDFGQNANPLWLPLTTWLQTNEPVAKEEPAEVKEPKKQAAATPCDLPDAESIPEATLPEKGKESKKETESEPEQTMAEKMGVNIARVPSMQGRAHPTPVTDPIPAVSKGLMTSAVNSIIHHIKTGRWEVVAPTYSVAGAQEGIKIPPEYLNVVFNKKDPVTGQTQDVLVIKFDKETNTALAKDSLIKAFGLPEAEIAALLPNNSDPQNDKGYREREIPLKSLYEKSSLAQTVDYDEFIKFTKAIVEMPAFIKPRFRSHGTIYLTMLKDLREHVSKMNPGEFRFTSFNHPMFVGNYGPIKGVQRSDLAVNSMYFIISGASDENSTKLAQAFGAPENFDLYHDSYSAGSNRVDPKKDDISSIDDKLKAYYDCAKAEEEDYYCNEAILNAGQNLHHRIKVTKNPILGYLAPWDLMLVPGKSLTDNGMYSNSGEWGFIKLKNNKTMGFNLRMLNTRMDNEEKVQDFAFGQMAGFLDGAVKHAIGAAPGYKMTGTSKFKQ